nr:MAG TPA: hypothetical protein [Caudoviricetes sp.]
MRKRTRRCRSDESRGQSLQPRRVICEAVKIT